VPDLLPVLVLVPVPGGTASGGTRARVRGLRVRVSGSTGFRGDSLG